MKPKRLKIIPVSLDLKLKIHNWLFKNEKQKLSVISVQAKKSLNDTNKIFCKIKVRESRHSDLSFVIDLYKNICLQSNSTFNYYSQWVAYTFYHCVINNKRQEFSIKNISEDKCYLEIKKEILQIAETYFKQLENENENDNMKQNTLKSIQVMKCVK